MSANFISEMLRKRRQGIKVDYVEENRCNVRIRVGDEVLIETEFDLFAGRIDKLSKVLEMLELNDAKSYITGEMYQGMNLRMCAIQCIRHFKKDKSEPTEENTLNLTRSDLEHIWCIAKNNVIINGIAKDYRDAITDISKQDRIALYPTAYAGGAFERFSMLAVATKTRCYLFDMLAIGKDRYTPEFRQVFQGRTPLKIVHNSKYMAKLFQYTSNINFNGFFDTFLANMALNGTTLNFVRFVHSFVKLTPLFQHFDSKDNRRFDPHPRPYNDYRRMHVAKKAACLFKVYEYMPMDKLPPNFELVCAEFGAFKDSERFELPAWNWYDKK